MTHATKPNPVTPKPLFQQAGLARPIARGLLVLGSATSHHLRLEFRYRIIRLWQQPVDSCLRGGLAALPLATLCQMPPDQPLPDALRKVVLEIDRRLGREADHAEAIRLMTAAYILTGLRVPKGSLASIYKGIGLMQETTAFDEATEEGYARGRIEGERLGEARVVLRLGRKRFGDPDSATEAALMAVQDFDRLERLAEAVLTAKSWKELLETQ